MDMKIAERVLERLVDPGKWTDGTMARDEHGVPSAIESPHAVSWCLQGAFFKETGCSKPEIIHDVFVAEFTSLERKAEDYMALKHPGEQYQGHAHIHLNDVMGHSEVIKFLRWVVKNGRSKRWTLI